MLGGGLRSALGDDGLERDGPVEHAGRGRPARWKLTTTVRGSLLLSFAWLLTSFQDATLRSRRGRAFAVPLEHRWACRHRIDRMLATDPQSRLAPCLTDECSGATPKPSPIASTSGPITRRIPSEAARTFDP
jgi:hypothetical protein